MFGASLQTAFLLWTIMDVATKGPAGGHHVHMLWMLLFLKGYPNVDTLSGICCASTKTGGCLPRTCIELELGKYQSGNCLMVLCLIPMNH